MKIKYAKQALKVLSGYDKPTRDLIREKVRGLTDTAPKGDIKPLHGSENEMRLRVGKYRVIFECLTEGSFKVLMVNKIDTRGGVYKK